MPAKSPLEHITPWCDNKDGGAAAVVTPDEVLTLGVLALAGLWPGCWSGIAAIIVHRVERLVQSGAVDAPFRRCAHSLVDMLLRSPGEADLAVETRQQLSIAQTRLPDELGQVLDLACSLLQRRAMVTADARAKKKRRRSCSSEAVVALTAPIPLAPPSCTAALVTMITDFPRTEKEQELERPRKRQRELGRVATPRLRSPSEVRPPLLQQRQPPTPHSLAVIPHQQIAVQLQVSTEAEATHPVHPPSPHLLYTVAPALGGTEASFPVLFPHPAGGVPSPTRPAPNWQMSDSHNGLQESDVMSPPHPPDEVEYPPHLAASSGSFVSPSVSEAMLREGSCSTPRPQGVWYDTCYPCSAYASTDVEVEEDIQTHLLP